jgi:hypothetical protein
MAQSNAITNSDFSANGVAILKDSGAYPVQEGSTDEGINGLIRFTRISMKRDLTVEFRSEAALAGFMASVAASADAGLLVNYNGTDYYLDSMSCSSTWGGFGSEDTNTVWEYDISLKRPANLSDSSTGHNSGHIVWDT